MNRHISFVSRAANFNQYRLGKIRCHLTTEATMIPVHSLVIHIDYANSLLTELPKKKLKRVGFCITPSLPWHSFYRGVKVPRLHWLPVLHWILFKVSLFYPVYRLLHWVLLRDCIQLHVFLCTQGWCPRRGWSRRGRRAYPNEASLTEAIVQQLPYAPYFWNRLPLPIRTTTARLEFKQLLKTNFFTLSYPVFKSLTHSSFLKSGENFTMASTFKGSGASPVFSRT